MEARKEYKWPWVQTNLRFPREMYVEFKAGCLVRDTSAHRLIHIWIERQVEAWRQEQRKELLPQENTNGTDDSYHTV